MLGLFLSRGKILWSRYLKGLAFTFIMGVGQIVLLQNLGNVPAWYYPDGSALGRDWITFLLPNTCFEDIVFVPVCYSLFYLFMYLIRDVRDFARDYLPHVAVGFVIGIFLFGYTGGRMAGDMISYLLLPTLVIYGLIKDWMPNRYKKQNITHALLALTFVVVFTALGSCYIYFNWHYFFSFGV